MLKIIYAASNNYYSNIQLARVFNSIKELPIIIKIAAYKNHLQKIYLLIGH